MTAPPLWVLLAACSPLDTGRAAPDGPGVPGADTAVPADVTARPTGDTGTAMPPFTWSVHTETIGDAIALRTALPWRVDLCLELRDAPCEDVDLDGLTDAWEDAALDRLVPAIEFDESEPSVGDPSAVLAAVGRVSADLQGGHLRVFIMLGYDEDYGRCGLSGHHGDSERVALDLRPIEGADAGDVEVVGAYTAAHENTLNDSSQRFVGADLGLLDFPADPITGEPRWRVYSSDGKHATYGTVQACESARVLPCLDEDCGRGGESAADFIVQPPIWNAGEEQAPRLTDLAPVGFPGEEAWAPQDFCGGTREGLCSAPVRDKLLDDPF